MKKRLSQLMICVVLACAGQVSADILSSSPSQRASLQTEFMKSKLDLDAVTLDKVDKINQRYADLAEPILKGEDGLFKKRSRMEDLMAKKDKELQAVLNSSQFKRYDDSKDDLKSYVESRL